MILETQRLLMRPWEDRDRLPLAAIMGDPVVRRFYPGILTPEETSAEIDRALEKSRVHGFHMQAAELKSDGSLVGLIGLGMMSDLMQDTLSGRPSVEIGWVFGQRYWGRGLAPEGARAWLEQAWKLGLPEIVAFTAAINLPSQRVMQKLGMTRDPAADFQHPKLPPGHPLRPHVLYRLQRPEALPEVSPAAPR